MKTRETYYIESLKSELEMRMLQNPKFSLRAFSKKLDMDASNLSKILKGKRRITDQIANKLFDKLGISPPEYITQNMNAGYSQLNEQDQFFMLSHWMHFSILELLANSNTSHSVEALTERLDANPEAVRLALERLERLKFVAKKNNKYVVLKPSTQWVSSEHTTLARKNFQKKLLVEAIDKLEFTDFSKRDNSSTIMSFDIRLMPIVREKIKNFRRELDAFIESESKQSDDVYSLAIAFFPLTKEINNKVQKNKRKSDGTNK